MRSLDGTQEDLEYDQLIVAVGSVSPTLPIPGLAEHANLPADSDSPVR